MDEISALVEAISLKVREVAALNNVIQAKQQKAQGYTTILLNMLRAGGTTGDRGLDLTFTHHHALDHAIAAAYNGIEAAMRGKVNQAVLLRCVETRLVRSVPQHYKTPIHCFRLGFLTGEKLTSRYSRQLGYTVGLPINSFVVGDVCPYTDLQRFDDHSINEPAYTFCNPLRSLHEEWERFVIIGDDAVRVWLTRHNMPVEILNRARLKLTGSEFE